MTTHDAAGERCPECNSERVEMIGATKVIPLPKSTVGQSHGLHKISQQHPIFGAIVMAVKIGAKVVDHFVHEVKFKCKSCGHAFSRTRRR